MESSAQTDAPREPTRRDTRLIYAARSLRAFGFGYIGVLLALYLQHFGFGAATLGLYLSLAALCGAGTTFAFSRIADRVGRRRILMLAAALYAACGLLLFLAQGPVLILLAALPGTIPPGGNGLFSAVDQAMLGGHDGSRRTSVFALYGFLGSGATTLGSLAAGLPAWLHASGGVPLLTGYRGMMALYAVLGLAIIGVAALLGDGVEAGPRPEVARPTFLGLHRSRGPILTMAALFVADSFGSGMVATALLVYWLHTRLGMDDASLALLFAAVSVCSTISFPLSVPLAKRIGLINTAVWTHIPSSVFLAAVAFVPSVPAVVVLLLLRGLLVQMDVPTRQAYIAAVVDPDERAAAAGVTTLGQQVGSFAGPAAGGFTLTLGPAVPLVIAAGVKIAYDLTLWQQFRHVPTRT
ncbi:MAG TPA: MFS transporter [Bacillota bacterium]|nr:MFS transporter [Bacillota bacterium]